MAQSETLRACLCAEHLVFIIKILSGGYSACFLGQLLNPFHLRQWCLWLPHSQSMLCSPGSLQLSISKEPLKETALPLLAFLHADFLTLLVSLCLTEVEPDQRLRPMVQPVRSMSEMQACFSPPWHLFSVLLLWLRLHRPRLAFYGLVLVFLTWVSWLRLSWATCAAVTPKLSTVFASFPVLGLLDRPLPNIQTPVWSVANS